MTALPLPDSTLLAPLTKGGNLPFRRLCVDFGAVVTMSEMAYARQVVRGSRSELVLLRKHDSERCFGVQLAVSKPEDGVAAAAIATERGAAFVDVNAGCPIHDVVRRGMGATLLRRPKALARIVEAMVAAADVPVTVKIRAGWKEGEINAPEIARLVEESGAAMLTVHARTREQRYTRAADWELVRQIAAERSIPVVGNGDVLTWYEAEDRRRASGCAGVMLARGALVKPWLFQEIAERRDLELDARQRLAILLRFVGYLKEHFRDDDKGRQRSMRFLPWHLDFFARWRPLPAALHRDAARRHPLLQSRLPVAVAGEAAELPLLERVLRDPHAAMHRVIAGAAWAAADVDDLVRRLEDAARDLPPEGGTAPEVRTAEG